MDTITRCGIISGNKFHQIPTFLKDMCFCRDLKLELDIDSGWFSQTVRYRITGPADEVNSICRYIKACIEAQG